MKWLATAFLCLLAMPALAQNSQILRLPTALFCGETSKANAQQLKEQYGELPFLEGVGEVMSVNPTQSYQGTVKMFLDPTDGSYSLFLELEGNLTCLIVTGEQISPVVSGDQT